MSWPHIVKCYNDIVEDPSLLWLFLEKEWTSLWELPLLSTLQFRLILERSFTCIASPDIQGKARVEFATHTAWSISGEAIPMVVLVTDGVGEGNLGLVKTFCCHDEAKMEPSDVLSALCWWDSSEPTMVVLKRYTNTPYIPQGTSWLLFLDVSMHQGGNFSTQFPLHQLWLCRLIPLSANEVVLPWEKEEVGYKLYPYFQQELWPSLEEVHCHSNPVSLLVPSSALLSHWEEGTKTEEDSGYHLALQWLKDVNQGRIQLECELNQEAQELAQWYDDCQIKLARKL